jgi:hypothetical protein
MRIAIVTAALLAAASAVQAQTAPLNFEQAAYVTCREAHAMNHEARKSLSVYLAEHAARYRGVAIPHNDERGAQLAMLVRGGCTLAPDAYLFTVIDRAILAEKDRLPKR